MMDSLFGKIKSNLEDMCSNMSFKRWKGVSARGGIVYTNVSYYKLLYVHCFVTVGWASGKAEGLWQLSD